MRSFFSAAAFLWLLLGALATVSAQQSNITLNDIWASRELFPSYFPGFQWHEGGKSYLEQTEEGLVYFDTKTGAKKGILMPQSALKFEGKDLEADDFNVTESGKIVVSAKSKGKYRRSKMAEYYIYNPATKTMAKADPADALEENATLSPDGKFVAYMRENNVFVTNLASGATSQVTTDGKLNEIINGACDWVYEEEFEFAQAIYWSSDSKRIAFYRFDERQVSEYNMQVWKGLYPKDYRYKYPKAGDRK
jgi:dipeptidyl-peptidase-4